MRHLRRREVLGLLAGAAVARRALAEAATRTARDAADHIVIGISDLERGIGIIEARTGVRPALGGAHPGRGTWNALFSLGAGQYAELIAPDPKQKDTADAYGLTGFAQPRLLMWAASTPDIDALATRLAAAGLSDGEVHAGARLRPDGRRLSWRTLATRGAEGLAPFFIEWDAGSTHPSADSPAGCRLESLSFAAPDPAAAEGALGALGLAGSVERGAVAGLRVTLSTRKAPLSL